jgi:hypothetical protein
VEEKVMIGHENGRLALVTFSGPEPLPRLPTTPFASRKIAAAYAHAYDFRENAHSPTFVDLDVCAVIASGDQETYRATARMRVLSTQIAALVFIKEAEAEAWMNSVETLPDLSTP